MPKKSENAKKFDDFFKKNAVCAVQKHVNLVDLVKSFPTNIFLQNLASIQKRTSPIKFAHLAERSEKGSISNLSTKVSLGLLALHADRAQLKTGDLTETKYAQTSVVPFAAFLDGRQAWSALAEELDPQNAAAAVLVAVLFSVRPSWMRFVR